MPESAQRNHPIDTGGPWGTGLLIAGLGSVVLGCFYVFGSLSTMPPALQWLDSDGLPVAALGSLWIIAGGFAVFEALTPPQRHWHIAPVVAVMSLWSGLYTAHWLVFTLLGQPNHDWQGAVVWGLFAAMLINGGRCVNPPRRRRR